jgi:hypothetical protein
VYSAQNLSITDPGILSANPLFGRLQWWILILFSVMALLLSAAASDLPATSISTEGWRLQCSPAIRCRLNQAEGGKRLDYDYPTDIGLISFVKAVNVDLPKRYDLVVEMRAEATDADSELKMSETRRLRAQRHHT